MTTLIYHNPRCSKSRQTLALLEERGLQPTVVEYLETPPTPEQLQEILAMLNLDARGLMRTKELVYQEQGLADPALTQDQLVAAMVATPILIERPIVVRDGRAALGRPPENVLSIL